MLLCSFHLKSPFLPLLTWTSEEGSLKSSIVSSPYLTSYHPIGFIVQASDGFRAHGLFLLLCPGLPWAAQVIQKNKKGGQGHTGHSLSLIPIINCFLISGNDSGKWACQTFAYSPCEQFIFGHGTHTLRCRCSVISWLGDTEPDLNLAGLQRAVHESWGLFWDTMLLAWKIVNAL